METERRLPKMILFDYGHTLAYEPNFDALRGERALQPYYRANPRGVSPEEVAEFSEALFQKIAKQARGGALEIHYRQFRQLVWEYLQIEVALPFEAMEDIYWDAASPGEVMSGTADLLRALKRHQIRSGVISNLSFSGAALRARLDRLLPGNGFEFALASSEYVFRKPLPMLFAVALRKAGLDASDVWYCGDNPRCDVEGAAGVGIYPVWYRGGPAPDRSGGAAYAPSCQHLEVYAWEELTRLLDSLGSEG